MKKLYISKTFSKAAGGRRYTPHILYAGLQVLIATVLYSASRTEPEPPLAISYKNHQKSLAYFSHLAPLILLIFTKRQS